MESCTKGWRCFCGGLQLVFLALASRLARNLIGEGELWGLCGMKKKLICFWGYKKQGHLGLVQIGLWSWMVSRSSWDQCSVIMLLMICGRTKWLQIIFPWLLLLALMFCGSWVIQFYLEEVRSTRGFAWSLHHTFTMSARKYQKPEMVILSQVIPSWECNALLNSG